MQTGAHSDVLTVEDIERARDMLLEPDTVLPLQVTTREARTVFMVPGPVIRIMRHDPMMWRGQWLKVID